MNLLAIFAGTVFSIIFLKYLPLPYVWMSIWWLFSFGYLTAKSKNWIQKHVWFNLGFIVLVCGALEVYSYWSHEGLEIQTTHEGGYIQGYFTPNNILGYGPSKDKTVTSRKYNKQQLIYDVSYTIDSNGLRITPPSHNDHCVLFFGDSFTFGEGVADREAMPYVVGELSNYRVYNFGFHGYGPHQMLSAIEHGMVKSIVDCQPGYAIYQVITEQVRRSVGKAFWDKQGPMYVVSAEGLKYAGHFDDVKDDAKAARYREILQDKLRAQVELSYVYKKYLKQYFKNTPRDTDEDVRRFLEIVDASRKKLMGTYQGLQFHVILWPYDSTGSHDRVRTGLLERGINLHEVANIIPDWSTNKPRYILSKYDNHPNATAYARIAEYVVKSILSHRVNFAAYRSGSSY